MTFTATRSPETADQVLCPGCGRMLDLEAHADLVCDGRVWCLACRAYPPELPANRSFQELEDWSAAICAAFAEAPVLLLEHPEARYNWRLYWQEEKCLLAAAYHEKRAILLYPPGQRLTTLCHELAHIFTGKDHTRAWAEIFARLVAWVRENL
jgi:hypothetical protein